MPLHALSYSWQWFCWQGTGNCLHGFFVSLDLLWYDTHYIKRWRILSYFHRLDLTCWSLFMMLDCHQNFQKQDSIIRQSPHFLTCIHWCTCTHRQDFFFFCLFHRHHHHHLAITATITTTKFLLIIMVIIIHVLTRIVFLWYKSNFVLRLQTVSLDEIRATTANI